MIDELQLFRGQDYYVNDYITIHHPTLDEISNFGEQEYYSMVSTICATPSEYKVQLFDAGIDYETVQDFEFFMTLRNGLDTSGTNILFYGLDFSKFIPVKNTINDDVVLYNPNDGSTLDSLAYNLIVSFLRKIHGFKKVVDRTGNAATKQFLIDEERRKQDRHKNKEYKSMLIPLISSMINCEQFKYNHKTVWELPIYTFMDSVQRIQKIKNYDQLMQGAYSGCVDLKNISTESLNWLGDLDK